MIEIADKIIVGSEEWCGLPQLGIPAVKARIDSGAKTSALHAFNIRSFKRNGISWVSYELHPIQHNRRVIVRCESEVVDRRMVKSSSGVAEKRYVIKTLLQLGGYSWEIEVTLTNRDSMGYRMLFGRTAMVGRVLVDPSSKLLCGNYSKEEIHKMYGHAPAKVDGLKIGLLASNPDLHSNKRIMQAAEERGHDIRFYDIKQCYMKLDPENPEIHYSRGHTLNELDAIIPRIKPALTRYGCALVRQFASIGVFSLNSANAISNSRDKLLLMQSMIQHGLDIPPSCLANTPTDVSDLIAMIDGPPLVVNMLQGPKSEGVVTADTAKSAESVINAFKSVDADLLIQAFIREAGGSNLRLLVVDGKVIATMLRQRSDHDNFADDGDSSAHAARVTQAEKRLAVAAAKALGLKVAGVDILRSSNGPLLLDINATPELKNIEAVTGKDLAATLIHAVEKKLKWKRPLHSGVEVAQD